MRARRTPLRAVVAALGLSAACAVGFVSSGLAAGDYTIPGTTVTITTGADGRPDLSQMPSLTNSDGRVDPAVIAKLLGITVPPGVSIPSTGTGVPTTPTATLSTTATAPSSATVPGVTTPAPVATGPDLSSLLGAGKTPTQTQTTKQASASEEKLATMLLVLFGGLLLACALLFAGARLVGWEPGWWSARRHEVGEASWRISGGGADFRDWLRGRL